MGVEFVAEKAFAVLPRSVKLEMLAWLKKNRPDIYEEAVRQAKNKH